MATGGSPDHRSFQSHAHRKKDSIFVYGGSRGAVIAAMVATKDSRIAGFILRSGLYDLVDAYQKYPWYSLIKLAMIREIGWSKTDALKERSALYFADKIRSLLLILHGERDDLAPVTYVKLLAEKVRANGTEVDLFTFDSEHIVPQEKVQEHMQSFLERLRK